MTSQQIYNRLNFNPRSPWGERLLDNGVKPKVAAISIHAPRGGSDPPAVKRLKEEKIFQSTLPVGGATVFVLGVD